MATISKEGSKVMGRIFSEPLQLEKHNNKKIVWAFQTYRSV